MTTLFPYICKTQIDILALIDVHSSIGRQNKITFQIDGQFLVFLIDVQFLAFQFDVRFAGKQNTELTLNRYQLKP